MGKRLPSAGRFWTPTSPLDRDRRCHAIHLLLRSLVLIFTMAFVLFPLLLLRPFINDESIELMVNQLGFVCDASTGIKTTRLIELGLWRRSTMA